MADHPGAGLYTGVAIFGAVGSGKTSACMHPFARQLLSWHATNPERRAAALVLEVKGDFCHDIRRMLTELDRGGDYIELSLDGRLTWNPLSATWLHSYSLAYTVASLLNQLFGKGKEPFWQQAYTNIDLLGLYLTTLLDIGEVEPDVVVTFTGMSAPLDSYYNSLEAGVTLDKPRPTISPLFASIFSQLEQRGVARWTEIGVALNMFSPDDQNRITKMLAKLESIGKSKTHF